MHVRKSCVLAVLAISLAATGASADLTPPVIVPHVSGTVGSGGWYVSDVTVTWDVSDEDSSVTSTAGCGPVVVTLDTTGDTYACFATSLGGTSSASVSILKDATPPVIDFVGAKATYGVDEAITIYCNTFDATSGVAATTCTTLTGLGYTFPLNTPITHAATASDNAGNTITSLITFTVTLDYASLGLLVEQLVMKESSVANLQRKLQRAQEASTPAEKTRNIESFIDQLTREEGRTVDPADAALLIELARQL